jgi:hypothetical protein
METHTQFFNLQAAQFGAVPTDAFVHQPPLPMLLISPHALHQTGSATIGNVLDFCNRVVSAIHPDSLITYFSSAVLGGALG